MYIQPISSRHIKSYTGLKKAKQIEKPVYQSDFKGIKGFIKGEAAGAGITAFGVAFVGGIGAVPAFIPYVILNSILGAFSGGMLEENNKE